MHCVIEFSIDLDFFFIEVDGKNFQVDFLQKKRIELDFFSIDLDFKAIEVDRKLKFIIDIEFLEISKNFRKNVLKLVFPQLFLGVGGWFSWNVKKFFLVLFQKFDLEKCSKDLGARWK